MSFYSKYSGSEIESFLNSISNNEWLNLDKPFVLDGTLTGASGVLTNNEIEIVKKSSKILAKVKEFDNVVLYEFNRAGLNAAKTYLYFCRFYVFDTSTSISSRVIAIDLSTGEWSITAISNLSE